MLPVRLLVLALCAGSFAEAQYTIKTFAGGGPNNIAATSAGLGVTTGLAFDSKGNLYVASQLGQVFRIDGAGQITVYAGLGYGVYSGDNGPAVNAGLALPSGIAFDGSDNLYMIDYCRIRKVDAITKVITTLAGTGACGFNGDGPVGGLNIYPSSGIIADPAGNVFFSDFFSRIRKISGGTLTTIAGTGT